MSAGKGMSWHDCLLLLTLNLRLRMDI